MSVKELLPIRLSQTKKKQSNNLTGGIEIPDWAIATCNDIILYFSFGVSGVDKDSP